MCDCVYVDVQDLPVDRAPAMPQWPGVLGPAASQRTRWRLSSVQPRHAADRRGPLPVLSRQSLLRRTDCLQALPRLHGARHSPRVEVVEQPAPGRARRQQLCLADWSAV